ncbi:STAS domain-containing protein [Kitasatospora purpeofusca]|uniref:STAS domain-containing protein n=1 Tax=Kitasatospora purpeofusca TaxID=67352 RepID=UPI0036BFD238
MTENAELNSHGTGEWGSRLLVVRPRGELDWESAQEFAEQVGAVVERCPDLVIADLSEVTFADSSSLHTLFDAHRRLSAAGGRLVVAGPLSSGVRRLFEVSATTDYFHFAPNAEVAAAAGGPAKSPTSESR